MDFVEIIIYKIYSTTLKGGVRRRLNYGTFLQDNILEEEKLMTITFNNCKAIQIEQLERLYTDVQWYAYTKDIEVPSQDIWQSLEVITAWVGEELVGLIRIVGDGLTSIYIQDILVLNAYQN
ncbi:hypothetical protein ACIG6B_08650 [Bacillus mobilis]